MPFVLNSINKKVHLKNEVTFCVNSRIDAQKSALVVSMFFASVAFDEQSLLNGA